MSSAACLCTAWYWNWHSVASLLVCSQVVTPVQGWFLLSLLPPVTTSVNNQVQVKDLSENSQNSLCVYYLTIAASCRVCISCQVSCPVCILLVFCRACISLVSYRVLHFIGFLPCLHFVGFLSHLHFIGFLPCFAFHWFLALFAFCWLLVTLAFHWLLVVLAFNWFLVEFAFHWYLAFCCFFPCLHFIYILSSKPTYASKLRESP